MKFAEFRTADGKEVWINPAHVVYAEPDLTKHEVKLTLLGAGQIVVLELAARAQEKLEMASGTP